MMRNKRYYISLIIVVLSCSLMLISCDAITAQNITNTDSGSKVTGGPDMNGGTGRNGSRGMDGGPSSRR